MCYEWENTTTGTHVSVDRSMKDSGVEPTFEESGMSAEEYDKAVWKKVITGGIGTIGFGCKGHWALLLGLFL